MTRPRLKPGRVYRTEHFRRYTKNPTRLVGRLVAAGEVEPLRKGLYYAPRRSSFGRVPPTEDELLRAYFRGRPYLRTGPSVWNALGLGATAVEAFPLVYNTTRTGPVRLAGRRFDLRRVRFPRNPPPEYFVVDLLENSDRAGLDLVVARRALAASVAGGRIDPDRLLAMASEYGALATQSLVRGAVSRAAA